jgi:hypothetical protein
MDEANPGDAWLRVGLIAKKLLEASNVDLRARYDYQDYCEGVANCSLLHLALDRFMFFKIVGSHEATLRMLHATMAVDLNARNIWGATALHFKRVSLPFSNSKAHQGYSLR